MEAVDPNRHSLGERREPKTVIFGGAGIRIEDVVALARGEVQATLNDDPGYRPQPTQAPTPWSGTLSPNNSDCVPF